MPELSFLILLLSVLLSIGLIALSLHRQKGIQSLRRAILRQQAGNLDGAEQEYTTAIQQNPKLTTAYLNRSVVYNAHRQYDTAIADLDRAISLNGRHDMAFNNRGYIYSIMGNFDQALSDCNRALQLNPRLANGYGSRGHTYFLMGRFEEARADFQKSEQFKPGHKFAIAGQAIAEHALGHDAEAKMLWASLLQLDPAYENPDKLMQDYHCADAFLEAAHQVSAL